jgi:hypothetical protein
MSQEMGQPGYPAGDELQETEQGETNATTPSDEQGAAAGDETTMASDTEQGGGEGDMNLDAIRRRAWEISQGDQAGTAEENWLRAEREIRTEQASP